MNVHVLDEPDLEFRAGNRHIDPRYGLATFGPADADNATRPQRIVIGQVGSAAANTALREWLQRCQQPITGKAAKPRQENMFPPFPGFDTDTAFGAELVFDPGLVRDLPNRQLRLLANTNTDASVADAVELYLDAAQSLDETGRCDVILCARPDELDDADPDQADHPSAEPAPDTEPARADFHDLLKARALSLRCPLQLVRRDTWTGRPPRADGPRRPLQDEATRAWNLHTALYYKAGGSPWRLPRDATDLACCYIGVSFYRVDEGAELHTAVAQVFNERGDGVVVRGGAARVSKKDRQPHLSEDDARQLLDDALAQYRTVHGHLPARIVLHKTSSFSPPEVTGFSAAADARQIDHLELLWVQRRAAPRLFRDGALPPLRGTTLRLATDALVVYTRGSVEFFHTYPGMYVPQPLLLRPVTRDTDLLAAARDVLGLSKMNWNNAQLDERDPLTLRTASSVGKILRHVPGGQQIANRYAFYM